MCKNLRKDTCVPIIIFNFDLYIPIYRVYKKISKSYCIFTTIECKSYCIREKVTVKKKINK